jgi:hypothetical protein
MTLFTVQTWDGDVLISIITGLSIDAAREIVRAARLTGHTARIVPESA